MKQVDVVIVGAGFSGLYLMHRCLKANRTAVVLEQGSDVGGTWYWNRYPGAMCDTASLIYLPLLEETGHLPTEKYTRGPEILEHCRRIARHFDLYDDAVFSTEVTGLTWDAEHRQWVISTDRGDAMRARHVCVGTGPLHKAKLPGIPGIGDFTGHSFHTSRWDYDYTGGDPEGSPMTGLADRRVGIIGTGATAVQCIPHLSRSSGELFVFQRTPSSIDVRANRVLDYDELTPKMGPGWQRRWLENFTILQTGGIAEEDLVTNSGAKPGDLLFLSKPLGSGCITTGVKREQTEAAEVEAAYHEAAAAAPVPAIDQRLIDFMVTECDFSMEHSDGTFLEHLVFCHDYAARYYPEHSPNVALLHSILGTATNTFAMEAAKIPLLE